MIERVSKAQRCKFKKLILNYNYKILYNIYFLKKKMMNVVKEWRKEVINDRKWKCQSEEKNYLFISESHHALLTLIDTYKMKIKWCNDDEKWWEWKK